MRTLRIAAILAAALLAAGVFAAVAGADPIKDAEELKKTGDIAGAHAVLKKAETDLLANLDKNTSELKAQSAALERVSDQATMDQIKKKNDALVADRKSLKDQLTRVRAALEDMGSALLYQPYREKDAAPGYAEFIEKNPSSPFGSTPVVGLPSR